MTLATLAELKARLGVTDTTDDTALTAHLQRVEDRMAAHCHRVWAVGNQVEYFDGETRWLLVAAFPLVTLTSVTIDAVTVADALIVVRADRGRIGYLGTDCVWPAGAIVATYRGGYAAAGSTPGQGETLAPAELGAALLMQAEYEWRNKDALGLAGVSQGGANINAAAADWLPAVREAMSPYRRF